MPGPIQFWSNAPLHNHHKTLIGRGSIFPLTRHAVFMRYHEFFHFDNDQVVEMETLVDGKFDWMDLQRTVKGAEALEASG